MGSQVTREMLATLDSSLGPPLAPTQCSPWVIPPAPRLHPPSRKPLVHAHLELRLGSPWGPTTLHSSRPTPDPGQHSSCPEPCLSSQFPPLTHPAPGLSCPPPPASGLSPSPWTLTAASTLASRLSLPSFPLSAPKGLFLPRANISSPSHNPPLTAPKPGWRRFKKMLRKLYFSAFVFISLEKHNTSNTSTF